MEALRAGLNGTAHPDWRGWYRYYSSAPRELLTPVGTKSPILTMKVKLRTIKKKKKKKILIEETQKDTHTHTHTHTHTMVVIKNLRRKKMETVQMQKSEPTSWYLQHKSPEVIESILSKPVDSSHQQPLKPFHGFPVQRYSFSWCKWCEVNYSNI